MTITVNIDNSNNQAIKAINLEFYETGEISTPKPESKDFSDGWFDNNTVGASSSDEVKVYDRMDNIENTGTFVEQSEKKEELKMPKIPANSDREQYVSDGMSEKF